MTWIIARGSAAGREHRRAGRNNQDGYSTLATDDCLVAVLADGCGSSPHAEVGAKLGPRLLTSAIGRRIAKGLPLNHEGWLEIRRELTGPLFQLATAMTYGTRSEELDEIIHDFWLFTLVGVVITPEEVTFFHLGDGVIVINGQVEVLQSRAENKPDYVGYLLNGTIDPRHLEFKVKRMPASEIEHFLLGTDGVVELIKKGRQTMPGTDRKVGPISQLWESPGFYRHHDSINRWLRQLTFDVGSANGLPAQGGLLADDVTVLAGVQVDSKHPLYEVRYGARPKDSQGSSDVTEPTPDAQAAGDDWEKVEQGPNGTKPMTIPSGGDQTDSAASAD